VCRVRCCFFVSSRRRHTRSKRDWSSDVCSSDLARSSTTRCSHGRCGLLAPAGLEPGSGWSTTTPPGLPAGIAAAKPPGQWCATHRIPDIDTGSFRPRLSRFSSFCRYTLHIAADYKHPSDTKLKTLGAPRILGTIAAHGHYAALTFLPTALTLGHQRSGELPRTPNPRRRFLVATTYTEHAPR